MNNPWLQLKEAVMQEAPRIPERKGLEGEVID